MEFSWALLSCLCLTAAVSAGKLSSKLEADCQAAACAGHHIVATTVKTNATEDYVYLWSDIGAPAISVARTREPKSLNIVWNTDNDTKAEEPVFEVELSQSYIQTSVITRLLAVNTSTYDPTMRNDILFECNLMNKTWALVNQSGLNSPAASDVLANFTSLPDNLSVPCEFSLLFSTSDMEGREKPLPHLKYTENSTRLELVFNNFTLMDDNGTDLAKTLGLSFVLEMLIVPDASEDSLSLTSGKSLDDEYTPSQFWHSQIENGVLNGYHYWKPIVYTDIKDRSIKNSVHVETYKDKNKKEVLLTLEEAGLNWTGLPYSLATMLNTSTKDSDVRVLYLVFNATQDSTQVFNMVVGIGVVPSDSISLAVILIIALGLGLPGIVLIFGVPSVSIYRRVSRKKEQGYTPIQ